MPNNCELWPIHDLEFPDKLLQKFLRAKIFYRHEFMELDLAALKEKIGLTSTELAELHLELEERFGADHPVLTSMFSRSN